MTQDAADIATLVAVVVAGPWGLVLAIALVRGYSITLRIKRPRQPRQDSEQEQRRG